jgi:hypothetical protein
MTSSLLVARLRLWIALMSDVELAAMLTGAAEELTGRMHCDAANYVVRGVACLDADRLQIEREPATAEPPASA